MRTLSEQLAAFTAGVRFEELPEAVTDSVKARILDTVGVALAARDVDAAGAARRLAAEWGGRPAATVWGSNGRLPASSAALVNGTYAHSLDFDDTHLPSVAHPSATLVPAVLAQAEASSAGGPATVAALVAGYEVFARLATAQFDPELRNSVFFDRGLHATSIIGTVAAAGACAKLRGLNAEGIQHALGVACSMGAGLLEANRSGGTVKRTHCGWAAHAALAAAGLAAAGLTAPTTVFEGRFGFFQAYCGEHWNAGAVTDALGSRWETTEIFVKPYPCNHFTHAIVDAALELRENGLRPEQVDSVVIGTAAPSLRTIGQPLDVKQKPETPYLAAFSAPFVFATALCGGSGLGVSTRDFAVDRINDRIRLAVAARCNVVEDDDCNAIFPYQFPAVVRVTTTCGTTMTSRVLTTRGGPNRPLSNVELLAKFQENVGHEADALADRIAHFDTLESMDELFSVLSAAS